MTSELTDVNYCAHVVAIERTYALPGLDNLRGAQVCGSQVLVSGDIQAGAQGLFFPLETQLSHEFVRENNLYRKSEFGNKNPEFKGFFDENRRVRAIKFKGHKSEGFWIPLAALSFIPEAALSVPLGARFNSVAGVPICQKYVVRTSGSGRIARDKQTRRRFSVLPDQFRTHVDTENLRHNLDILYPETQVVVTAKWHGCAGVVANILIQRPLVWYERLARWFGVKVQETEYRKTWGSRRVLKGVDGVSDDGNSIHWYDEDVWGAVAEKINIPQGYSIYGEIVGFTPEGRPIQPGYSYGCLPKSCRFLIYRVTLTTPEGLVEELPWDRLTEFCDRYELTPVYGVWRGYLDQLVVYHTSDLSSWRRELLDTMTKKWAAGNECPWNPGLPEEGVVVRLENRNTFEAYKLKSFAFLERETKILDDVKTAAQDLEAQESEG